MWIFWAFISAIFAAVSRTCMKSAAAVADDAAILFARYCMAAPFAWLALAIVGVPEVDPAFWRALPAASILDLGAIIFMMKSLRSSTIAFSVPLLSISPAILLGTAYVLLGETPTPIGIMGVIVIAVGAYLLGLPEKRGSVWEPFMRLGREPGPRYMLGTAILFAFSGAFWKQAVASSSPYYTMALSMPLTAVIYALIHTLRTRQPRALLPRRSNFWALFAVAVSVFGVAAAVNIAFATGLASYVVAIKRMSILFNIILGAIVFREVNLRRNLATAGIMVAGAIMVLLG